MQHFYENIFGWFGFYETYSKMVNKFDNAHFVEIGAYLGKSTSYMAVEIINSKKNIRFDVIDTWEGSLGESNITSRKEFIEGTLYTDFLNNIEPVKDHINILKMTSLEGSKLYQDNSLDFVFIDADHSYESVKNDIESWLPKVKKGGYISGDDYNWSTVRQAVDEKFGGKLQIIFTNRDGEGTTWIYEK